MGTFSTGYMSVYLGLNMYFSVSHMPCSISMSSRLLRNEKIRFMSLSYRPASKTPKYAISAVTTIQKIASGTNTFQPSRMIWS